MAEDILDLAIDFVVDTTGHILAGIGVGPNNDDE